MRPYGITTYVYLTVLLLHLAAIVVVGMFPELNYRQELLFFSKLALMPVLVWTVRREAGDVSGWWVAAIGFSWLGDFWLADKPMHFSKSAMFLFGLLSFLLAHVCYLRRIHQLRLREMKGTVVHGKKYVRWVIIAAEVLVLAVAASQLNLAVIMFAPGSLAIVAYAIVLLTVFVRCVQLARAHGMYRPAAYGAGLFVISDALIGAGLVTPSLSSSATVTFFIMLLYGLAQLGLASLAPTHRTSASG